MFFCFSDIFWLRKSAIGSYSFAGDKSRFAIRQAGWARRGVQIMAAYALAAALMALAFVLLALTVPARKMRMPGILACAAAGMLLTAGAAEAKPKAAAFVMDAHTGRVIYARNADDQCYPASLTKVMTLYMLFEDLEAGKVRLDTPLRVSARASGQAPSRLGLKPGETITVRNAILALVTKSANDVAATVAENLAGTEQKFAQRMTARARAIGMKNTQFMNASGLPNTRQHTTARDMATLAKRVQTDFPQYYHYFSAEEFVWKGSTIRNHNRLLGKYQGTTGLKTGYIAASGFNLTATVARDGKSLIGVVMGGKSARARDAEMMAILDQAMPKAVAMRDGKTRFAAAAPTPQVKPAAISSSDRQALAALAAEDHDPDEESYTGTERIASLTAAPVPAAPIAIAPVSKIAAVSIAAPAVAPVAAPAVLPIAAPARPAPAAIAQAPAAQPGILGVLPPQQPGTPVQTASSQAKPQADQVKAYALAALHKAEGPVRQAGRQIGNFIVTPAQASEGPQATQPGVGLRTAVSESARSVPGHAWRAGDPLIPEGSWVIQIGAYADQSDAVERIRSAIKAAPSELGKAVPVTIPVKTADNRMLYRSRFGGFDGEREARNACGRLARKSISCITIPPANWAMPGNASKEKIRG